MDDVAAIIESLADRGYIRAMGFRNGEMQYEVTAKGRFALAEDDVKKWSAA